MVLDDMIVQWLCNVFFSKSQISHSDMLLNICFSFMNFFLQLLNAIMKVNYLNILYRAASFSLTRQLQGQTNNGLAKIQSQALMYRAETRSHHPKPRANKMKNKCTAYFFSEFYDSVVGESQERKPFCKREDNKITIRLEYATLS